jgi:hypothetical protein
LIHFILLRTGKRTREGAIVDFKNGAKRYALNNFMDGSRQVLIFEYHICGDFKFNFKKDNIFNQYLSNEL